MIAADVLARSGEGWKSGPIGLAVILGLCVALYFLFKSMSKHLRKVREGFPGDKPPATSPAPASSPAPATSPAAAPAAARPSGDQESVVVDVQPPASLDHEEQDRPPAPS